MIHQAGMSQTQVSYNKVDEVGFSEFKTFKVYDLDVQNIPEFEPILKGRLSWI
jgi:hypothetical protein